MDYAVATAELEKARLNYEYYRGHYQRLLESNGYAEGSYSLDELAKAELDMRLSEQDVVIAKAKLDAAD